MPPPAQLYDANGVGIIGDDGNLVPHARSFASIVNAFTKTYSYRWDEAIRDSPANALAMRRDVHLMALLQERIAPTPNNKWQLEVDDAKDAYQVAVKDGLTNLIKRIPRFHRMKKYLMEALWYGRYGAQVTYSKTNIGWTILNPLDKELSHSPVNGDKIQYQWDGMPVVFVEGIWAARQRLIDPDSIISTDRGAYGFRLYKPEYRRRFIIHTAMVNDADYFEGEMAGGARGVGLRSIIYWSNWLRTEVFTWMLQFMDSTGMMDLLIFNYESGNKAGKDAAETNAKRISGKMALAVPRAPGSAFEAIQVVQANSSGIAVLQGLIENYFDKGMERMFVGQSMTGGEGGTSGLEGNGKAELAKDTKSYLLSDDVANLDETLTDQLVSVLKEFNYPNADFPVRYKSTNPAADMAEKLATGLSLIGAGVPIKVDELRECSGYSKPIEGDETIGGRTDEGKGAEVETDAGKLAARPPADKPTEAELMQAYAELAQAYAFDESEHPRAADGKFGEGGGGGRTLHDKLAALIAEHPEAAAALEKFAASLKAKAEPKEPKATKAPKAPSEVADTAFDFYETIPKMFRKLSDAEIDKASEAVLQLSPGQLQDLADRMGMGPFMKRYPTLAAKQKAVRAEFLDRKHRIIRAGD